MSSQAFMLDVVSRKDKRRKNECPVTHYTIVLSHNPARCLRRITIMLALPSKAYGELVRLNSRLHRTIASLLHQVAITSRRNSKSQPDRSLQLATGVDGYRSKSSILQCSLPCLRHILVAALHDMRRTAHRPRCMMRSLGSLSVTMICLACIDH